MAAPSFAKLKPEYEALWAGMTIKSAHKSEVVATARQILKGRSRYEAVSAETGVPWVVVGLLHNMECSLSFKKHLHNGDPLNEVTTRVPAGRGPFDTWEESACDALRYDKLDKVTEWSVARIAYMAECFNGLGYRNPKINIPSPYLWSFTSVYEKGKFIADGKYSPVAVSQQVGVMATLRALVDIEPSVLQFDSETIDVPTETVEPHAWPIAEPPPAPAVVKVAAKSKSAWTIFGAIGAWFETQFGFVAGLLPDAATEVQNIASPLTSLGHLLRINLGSIIASVSLAALIVVLYRHVRDKRELETLKGE